MTFNHELTLRHLFNTIFMKVDWISDYYFTVKGTQYRVSLPIPIEQYKEDCENQLKKLKEELEYYKGLLAKLDFSEKFLNKAPMEVILKRIKIEEDTYKMIFYLSEQIYTVSTLLFHIDKVITVCYSAIKQACENEYQTSNSGS